MLRWNHNIRCCACTFSDPERLGYCCLSTIIRDDVNLELSTLRLYDNIQPLKCLPNWSVSICCSVFYLFWTAIAFVMPVMSPLHLSPSLVDAASHKAVVLFLLFFQDSFAEYPFKVQVICNHWKEWVNLFPCSHSDSLNCIKVVFIHFLKVELFYNCSQPILKRQHFCGSFSTGPPF